MVTEGTAGRCASRRPGSSLFGKDKKSPTGLFLYPPNSWKRGRDTFDSLINNAGHGEFAAMTALGRVGVPDDIGPMIASLLRDDNRWVTAQRIEVSGGQTI